MNTIQNSISIDSQYKTVDSGATQKGSVLADNSKAAQVSVPANSAAKATSTSTGSDREQKALDVLNKKLSQLNSDYMMFKKDKGTGLSVFELVDSSTHKVIKQYPSEEFLNMSKRLGEYLDRVLANQKQGIDLANNTSGSSVGNIISQTV
ncbi:flagellar protein FlaG [Hydrogenovibrio kuenenii]|uniref:flagellar protein FlaG n=1 Tax=Hydrogenovibrio kuenenii TaxID=63658 RepID=UPI0004670B95|nr:flagellar protein FlaG [Hydrogenovibrio kuenenii]